MRVLIHALPHAQGLPLPHYATDGSAGLDLLAAIDTDIELAPGARIAVPVGIALGTAISCGSASASALRPSSESRHHLSEFARPPSTSDYRGEIKVILINHGDLPFRIVRGMKIAQLVIARFERAVLFETEELSQSERGAGGFGSTGVTVKF